MLAGTSLEQLEKRASLIRQYNIAEHERCHYPARFNGRTFTVPGSPRTYTPGEHIGSRSFEELTIAEKRAAFGESPRRPYADETRRRVLRSRGSPRRPSLRADETDRVPTSPVPRAPTQRTGLRPQPHRPQLQASPLPGVATRSPPPPPATQAATRRTNMQPHPINTTFQRIPRGCRVFQRSRWFVRDRRGCWTVRIIPLDWVMEASGVGVPP